MKPLHTLVTFIYDPIRPYHRLLQTCELSKEDQIKLIKRKLKLNPFKLKKDLEIKLEEFFKLVRQNSGRDAA